MIWFQLRLYNPWHRDDHSFTTLWFRHWNLGVHKNLEIQAMRLSWHSLAGIELDTRWVGHDHGGIALELELLGCCVRIQLSDHRHWDHVLNNWAEP